MIDLRTLTWLNNVLTAFSLPLDKDSHWGQNIGDLISISVKKYFLYISKST